jgi:hypothetical protein
MGCVKGDASRKSGPDEADAPARGGAEAGVTARPTTARRSLIGAVRARRAIPGILALVIAGLGIAPGAQAGTYTVLTCSANPSVGSAGFSKAGAVNRFKIDQGCRDGGALTVTDGGVQTEGQVGAWRLEDEAPRNLTPRRLTFRARGNADQGLWPEIEGKRRGSGWERLVGGGGLPARRFRTVSRDGTFVAMRLRLRCTRRSCDSGNAHVRVKKVRFVVEDPTSPSAPRPAGQLVEQPVQRGIQVLGSEQSDGGTGIAGVSVHVNDAQVSRLPGSCQSGGRGASGRISLGLWRPCADTVTGAAIQTNDGSGPWLEGFNRLRLCADDFAGNSTCSKPRRLRVDNVCPVRPSGDTGQPPTELRLSFADGSAAKRVRFPRSPRLRATLRGVDGDELPTSSASICVGQTLRMANTPRIRTLTPTIPAGGGLGIAPQASRFFYANYWLNETQLLTARARLAVRARPRFEIKPARTRVGRKVRFIARLPGPRAQSKRVTLQVRQGKRWRMFRTGRTNRDGVHRRAYRFRTVAGKVRFRFRARVPRQRGYPYNRGTSKPRSIIVSG